MGKSKTAQRAAREAGKQVVQAPSKPKRHPWCKNPAFHQFERSSVFPFDCLSCNRELRLHVLAGECQTARRLRLAREG